VSYFFKRIAYSNIFNFINPNITKIPYRQKLLNYKNQLKRYELGKRKYYYYCLINHYLISCFYIGFFVWCLYFLQNFIENQDLPSAEIFFTIVMAFELLITIVAIIPRNKTICKDSFDLNLISIKETNTCLLIPFGGNDLTSKLPLLQRVLDAAKINFKPENIFLIHNGKTSKPFESIHQFATQNNINYCYVPVPSKSYALYYATNYLIEAYEYVMLIDADVLIGENLQMSTMENVDIFAYMISAEPPTSNDSYLNKLLIYSQDVEYRFAGFNKYLQSRMSKNSTTISHHGAASLYKKNILKIVMAEHDGIFDGEDYTMGIIAYFKGFIMKTIPKNYVIPTETPNTLYGLYQQRVNSWDYVILKFVPHQFYLIFRCDISWPIKINAFFHLWTVFQDFTRIITIIFILSYEKNNLQFALIVVGILVIKSLLIMFLVRCKIKHSPLKLSKFDNKMLILYYPFYTLLSYVYRLLGQFKYLFVYSSRIQNDILLKDRPKLPNILDYDRLENIDWDLIFINESV
jgi:hypothetical protein